MSARSVDARRVKAFNSSKLSQNICSNRPVMCRIPGCGVMRWRCNMAHHYVEAHSQEDIPGDLILSNIEETTLLANKNYFFGNNYIVANSPKKIGPSSVVSVVRGVEKQRKTNLQNRERGNGIEESVVEVLILQILGVSGVLGNASGVVWGEFLFVIFIDYQRFPPQK